MSSIIGTVRPIFLRRNEAEKLIFTDHMNGDNAVVIRVRLSKVIEKIRFYTAVRLLPY